MTTAPKKNERYEYFGMLCFVLLIIGTLSMHLQRNDAVDDAFITYRYAWNLVEGNGFVYNVGENVLGTTAPGYGLLLGLVAMVTGADTIPDISRWLNVFALLFVLIGTGFITYHLTHNRLFSVASAWLVTLAPNTAFVMVSGMETPVFLALTTCGLALALYGRVSWAAFLFGLSVWFRPEGVFFVGLYGLWLVWVYWQHRKTQPIRPLIGQLFLLGLPGLVEVAFLLTFYDTLLPQSLLAKSAGLYPVTIEAMSYRLVENGLRFFTPLFGTGSLRLPGAFGIPTLSLLALSAILWLYKKKSILLLIPIMYILLFMFYATSETLIMPWYYGHYEWFELMTYAIGSYALLSRISKTHIAAIATMIISVLALSSQHDWVSYAQSTPEFPYVSERVEVYYELTQIIDPQLEPGTIIAMPEIGVLGYFLPDVNVMDTAGLVTPAATAYFPIPAEQRLSPTVGAIPRDFIRDTQPDMIITLEIFGNQGLFAVEWFSNQYRADYIMGEEDYRGDDEWLNITFGSRFLYVFIRNDFTALDYSGME